MRKLLQELWICLNLKSSGSSPASQSLIADLFAKNERPRALGIFAIGTYLGIFLGYFIGGYVNQYAGELSLEGAGGRPAVQPFLFGGSRQQRGIAGLPGAVDDERRARRRKRIHLQKARNHIAGQEIDEPSAKKLQMKPF
jgi:hypothetical protein